LYGLLLLSYYKYYFIIRNQTKPDQTKPKYIQQQNAIDLDQEAMEETLA